mmetsp:Transcript_430/g.950  ORF Transcript_430/g.950 Transcript_430/m.950 type:complete len:252 (-) Transcript_430:82-837(-)
MERQQPTSRLSMIGIDQYDELSSYCDSLGEKSFTSFTSSTADVSYRPKSFDFYALADVKALSREQVDFNDRPQKRKSQETPARRGCMKVRTQRESLMSTGQRWSVTHNDVALPNLNARQSTVCFDRCTFIEHALMMGDNPSTESGPPIGIDWETMEAITFDIDTYEYCRGQTRRVNQELVIPARMRKMMLEEMGYGRQEIVGAIRQARKNKDRRSVSYHQQKFDPIAEGVESMRNGIKKMGFKNPMRRNRW